MILFRLPFIVFLVLLISCSSNRKVSNRKVSSYFSQPTSQSTSSKHFAKKLSDRLKKINANGSKEIALHENSDTQQCLRSICGPTHKNMGFSDLLSIEKMFPPIDETIEPILRSYDKSIASNFNFYETKMKAYKNIVNYKDKINISKETDLFFKKNIYFMFLKSFIEATILSNSDSNFGENISYDRDKAVEELKNTDATSYLQSINIQEPIKKYLLELFSQGHLFKEIIGIFKVAGLDVDGLLNNIAPGEDKTQAIIKIARRVMDLKRNFAELSPIIKNIFSYDSYETEKLLNSLPYNKKVLAGEFFNYYFYKLIYKKLSSKQKKIFEKHSIDYQTLIKNKSTNTQRSIINTFLKNKYKTAYFKSHQREKFKSTLKKILSSSNSPLRIETTKKYIEELKAIAQSKITFSNKKLQNEFIEKFNSLGFSINPDRQIVITSLSNQLDEISTRNNYEAQIINADIHKQAEYVALYFSVEIFQNSKTDNSDYDMIENEDNIDSVILDNLFSSQKDALDIYLNSTLSDAIYTTEGQAMVSWSTVRFPDYGVGVIAHEIGHFVSHIMMDIGTKSQGDYYYGLPEEIKYWQKRKDINAWHIKLDFVNHKNKGETYYTEEDWTDYFSGVILEEFKNKYRWAKNYGCSLIFEVDDLYFAYVEQDIDIKEPHDHSAQLFRVLNIQNGMNEPLSPSCQRIIKKNNLFTPIHLKK